MPSLQSIGDALLWVFSWITLTAIGVMVSGKVLARRIPLGLQGDDHFTINILVLKIKATRDEVSLGFSLFVLSLGIVVVLGGTKAYDFFEAQSGLRIGQWNSLCAIASFSSIAISAITWCVAPLLFGSPVISEKERAEQIRKITDIAKEAR